MAIRRSAMVTLNWQWSCNQMRTLLPRALLLLVRRWCCLAMLAERPEIRVIPDRRMVFVVERMAMLQAWRVGDVVVKPLVCLVDMLLLVMG